MDATFQLNSHCQSLLTSITLSVKHIMQCSGINTIYTREKASIYQSN